MTSIARLPKRGLTIVYKSVQDLVAALAEFSAVNYGRWADKRNLNTQGARNAMGLVFFFVTFASFVFKIDRRWVCENEFFSV